MYTPFLWRMGLLRLIAACLTGRRRPTGAGAPAPVPLVCTGAGTPRPRTRLLAAAVRQHPPASTSAVPARSGSTGDIRAAAAGARAWGWLARPLTHYEQACGRTSVPDVHTPLIGAQPTVREAACTCAARLARSTETTPRWPDGRARTVLTRAAGARAMEVLAQRLPGCTEVGTDSQPALRWPTFVIARDLHQARTPTPVALGLSALAAIMAARLPSTVRVVNGSVPTPDHVRHGRAPLVQPGRVVCVPHTLAPGAQAWLDVVRSPAAMHLLAAHGSLPGD